MKVEETLLGSKVSVELAIVPDSSAFQLCVLENPNIRFSSLSFAVLRHGSWVLCLSALAYNFCLLSSLISAKSFTVDLQTAQ